MQFYFFQIQSSWDNVRLTPSKVQLSQILELAKEQTSRLYSVCGKATLHLVLARRCFMNTMRSRIWSFIMFNLSLVRNSPAAEKTLSDATGVGWMLHRALYRILAKEPISFSLDFAQLAVLGRFPPKVNNWMNYIFSKQINRLGLYTFDTAHTLTAYTSMHILEKITLQVPK